MNEQLEFPHKLEHIYIHKKNKDYIIAIVSKDSESGKMTFKCLASENGVTGVPTSTGIFADNALPKPDDNIYSAALNLSKYLGKNGYKGVTTITQTKNGVKLS